MKQIKRLFQIDPWKISTNTLDRENLRLQESLTSIGNGYMGMRGNLKQRNEKIIFLENINCFDNKLLLNAKRK